MTTQAFNKLMNEHFSKLYQLQESKGADYSSDSDRLSHFKDSAASLGLTPEQVWAVFAGKHWNAVLAYCKAGQVESEPIEGRIGDLIVYCFLLLGLVEEKKPMLKVAEGHYEREQVSMETRKALLERAGASNTWDLLR